MPSANKKYKEQEKLTQEEEKMVKWLRHFLATDKEHKKRLEKAKEWAKKNRKKIDELLYQ